VTKGVDATVQQVAADSFLWNFECRGVYEQIVFQFFVLDVAYATVHQYSLNSSCEDQPFIELQTNLPNQLFDLQLLTFIKGFYISINKNLTTPNNISNNDTFNDATLELSADYVLGEFKKCKRGW
jgi:hypothetical protein